MKEEGPRRMAAGQPSFDRLDAAVDLTIAVLDEDGLADLAVANDETDHVTLLFRDRRRGLRTPGPLETPRRRLGAPARRSAAGASCWGMCLADVTGVGLADLITPNPDHVGVLVAEEDGGFRLRATLPLGGIRT